MYEERKYDEKTGIKGIVRVLGLDYLTPEQEEALEKRYPSDKWEIRRL